MKLLRSNRSFRLLFTATAVSNLGDGISALAFPWLATLITRDPTLIASVAFASKLPWFLFSIPAGVFVDRHNRKSLMVWADSLRLLLTFGVVGLIFSTPNFPPQGNPLPYILALAALAFLLGSAEVVRDNAAQTVLPSIVAKPDLETANGQLWSVEHVMGSFIGPPLAGVLIALAIPAPFLLDAATFAVAAFLVSRITIAPRKAPPQRPILQQMAEGWQWMRAHPAILRLAVMLGGINALSTMGLTILILFSQEILGLNAIGHGILLTAGAVGGVIGGLLGPVVVARLGGQRSVLLALAMMALPFMMVGLTSNPFVVGAALFIEMMTALLWNIVTVSYRQRLIPNDLLGRVNALYRFFGWGMMPIGALCGGWIVTLAAPELGRDMALRLPYFIGAFGACVMLIYGAVKLRL